MDRITFLDTETTGLKAGWNEIVEVACVVTDIAGVVLEEFSTLVMPENPGRCSEEAAGVNGFSLEEWSDRKAPTFAQIVPKVLQIVSSKTIVGHNLAFDMRFLRAELEANGKTVPLRNEICTQKLVGTALRLRGCKNKKLVTICEHLGVDHTDAHTALGDAHACRRVYFTLYPPKPEDRIAALEARMELLLPMLRLYDRMQELDVARSTSLIRQFKNRLSELDGVEDAGMPEMDVWMDLAALAYGIHQHGSLDGEEWESRTCT